MRIFLPRHHWHDHDGGVNDGGRGHDTHAGNGGGTNIINSNIIKKGEEEGGGGGAEDAKDAKEKTKQPTTVAASEAASSRAGHRSPSLHATHCCDADVEDDAKCIGERKMTREEGDGGEEEKEGVRGERRSGRESASAAAASVRERVLLCERVAVTE